MKRTKCPRCGYEWESKVPRPKECPRCKQRLDSRPTKPRTPPDTVPAPLPREIRKRVHDTQKHIDNLTVRITEVEGRVDRIEKKLRKMGGLLG